MEPNSVCGKRDSVGHRLRVLQQLIYPMLRTNHTGEHCNIGAQVLSLWQTCGGSWGFFVAVKSSIAGYLIKDAKNWAEERANPCLRWYLLVYSPLLATPPLEWWPWHRAQRHRRYHAILTLQGISAQLFISSSAENTGWSSVFWGLSC